MMEYHVLNLGAGVQSTTLYLMSMAGEIQRFDYAIFADTGEEPAAVYTHLEWLKSLGGPPILVRDVGSRLGDDLRHGMQPKGKAKFAAIPAFTIIEGHEPGHLKRQCSSNYKIEVIHRTIRRDVLGLEPRKRIPKGTTVHQYFGISLDEKSRATRIWERCHITGESQFIPHFPLIDRMMTRANCLDWLQGKVPHQVPRSACVFCPFHTDAEWQRIKEEDGPDWGRAVEVDHFLRTTGAVANRDMRQSMYVHRLCKPIDEIDFHPRTNPKEMQLGFGVECEGVCGV
jgi:hypothetical protein